MSERKIRDIMDTEPILLSEATPIREGIARLIEKRAPLACVVSDSGELVGVLTPKDCFGSAVNASYYQQWSGQVGEHMSSPARTLDAETDLIAAAQTFMADPIRAYPVTEAGRLAGVLTRHALLSVLVDLG